MLLENPQLAYALLQALVLMKCVDPQVAVAILQRAPDQIPPIMPPNQPPLPPQSLGLPLPGPPQQPMAPAPPPFAAPNVSGGEMRPPASMAPMGSGPGPRGPFGPPPRPFGAPMPAGPIGPPQSGPGFPSPYPPAPARPPMQMGPGPGPSMMGPPGPGGPMGPSRMPGPPLGMERMPAPQPTPASSAPSSSAASAAAAAAGPGGVESLLSGVDSEKAALILQVLQLSDEQVAQLPEQQRESIRLLKEQLAQHGALS